MSSSELNARILKIVKGYELNIDVSDEMSYTHSFMNPAYRQSLRALVEIIRQTRNFHKAVENATDLTVSNLLFQYSSNIIAFTAQRGGGKTRTMMSFAHILSRFSNGWNCGDAIPKCSNWCTEKKEESDIEKCKFFALPPIAPSILEGKQNILHIVLSRLYCYAETLLKPGPECKHITEKEKIDLVKSFQNCLTGINGIKHSENNSSDDLSALQDISDGIALRHHFYELIQCLLNILAPKKDRDKSYIILQLDDADSQIKCSYEVLEDVRKYLVIPNLIILMSADMDFVHNVILENHLSQFCNLSKDYNPINKDLARMCRKYIDKLIPPSHMVHLPQLDKCIDETNTVKLKYVDRLGNEELAIFPWSERNGLWDIQSTLLMLIYRKTGIVFAKPSSYLHNIIPRTMRGLNQLVYFLSEMEDIPDIKKQDWDSPATLTQAILKQLPVIEDNLSRFSNYFINDWISAKISNITDQKFLKEFSKSPASNRERLALNHLYDKYSYNITNKRTRADLYEILIALESRYRSQEDFLLFFSIRTLFSLESHKLVLKHKKKILNEYISSENGNKNIFVFNYNPDIVHLPKTYLLNEDVGKKELGSFSDFNKVKQTVEQTKNRGNQHYKVGTKIRGIDTFIDLLSEQVATKEIYIDTELEQDIFATIWDIMIGKSGSDAEAIKLLGKLMVTYTIEGNYRLNFINIITFVLCLGNDAFKAGEMVTEYEISEQQRYFYQMQEYALLIASNWDIQGKIYKEMKVTFEALPSDSKRNPVHMLSEIYRQIDLVINNINDGKLIERIKEHYNISLENSVWGIQNIFKKWFENKLKMLPNSQTVYECLKFLFCYIDQRDQEDLSIDPSPEHAGTPPSMPKFDSDGFQNATTGDSTNTVDAQSYAVRIAEEEEKEAMPNTGNATEGEEPSV